MLLICTSISPAQSRRTPRRQSPPPAPVDLIARVDDPPVDVSGKLTGQTYTNDYFGFSLTLPTGWQPQDPEVQKLTGEMIKQKTHEISDEKHRAATEASIKRTTLLLLAIKPTEELRNSVLMLMAEDLALAFNVRTPRQYLEIMRKSTEYLPIAYTEITSERIGGVDYGVLGQGKPDPQTKALTNITQYFYVAMRKHHALVFVMTPGDPKHLQECKDVLGAVKFQ